MLAGGRAVRSWAQAPTAQPGLELLESIYAVSATPKGLTVRMAPAGTVRSDIVFYVERRSLGASVAFGRRPASRRMPSRPPPGHTDIAFTYAELGVEPGAPLTVLNPLVAEPPRLARGSARKDARQPDGGDDQPRH